ncbi:alpha/beta fold hydrolase [Hyphococcus flavus]|uniref:Alpha/beta fold hydrolase n=1 Tax=Hyphococcus flavus TaxID=1866326 RepID=A0AAF0CBM4_9PROT|nr:alpha/beta fold hydrolase [Hyphococcus flavus]WDI31330.1 alpha/beta fold hydrolase [Hyphococcus flavus]
MSFTKKFSVIVTLAFMAIGNGFAQTPYPAPVEGDYTAADFEFGSGEALHELRIHYRTIGELKRDANGRATNAVLIMHGTTGTGASLLRESFADELFAPGGLLDAEEYFIILPDGIGHGNSSKPSDGLRMDFPKYDYDDMVRAQHLLLTEGLGVDHLRLVMGTSMGGMQSWVWGYTYPDFMDAIMPLASLPVEIAGRNRMLRKMIMDAIMADPEWNGGDYDEKPMNGLTAATYPLIVMVSSPLQYQKQAPTREESEAMLNALVERFTGYLDPNDTIYAFDASRNYDPSPHLHKIKAPLVAVNSADDQVNPPELKILAKEIEKVDGGRAVVLPITDQTRGHGSHSVAALWSVYLQELLERTE